IRLTARQILSGSDLRGRVRRTHRGFEDHLPSAAAGPCDFALSSTGPASCFWSWRGARSCWGRATRLPTSCCWAAPTARRARSACFPTPSAERWRSLALREPAAGGALGPRAHRVDAKHDLLTAMRAGAHIRSSFVGHEMRLARNGPQPPEMHVDGRELALDLLNLVRRHRHVRSPLPLQRFPRGAVDKPALGWAPSL